MTMRVMLACLLIGLVSTAPAAKTFRWSSQGDAATHDPHAQNEGVNNQINGQIYEQLLLSLIHISEPTRPY